MQKQWYDVLHIFTPNLDDIDRIVQIENSAPSPWTRSLIVSELHLHNSLQFLVFKKNRKDIIAWCCARIVVPESELLKITVAPFSRKKGTGTFLLHHLIASCKEAKCVSLFVEVRSQNHAAHNFYKKNHFSEIGRRIKYYSRPNDDAIILQKVL